MRFTHDETTHNQGFSSTIDLRYSPWDFGLYFNLSLLVKTESDHKSKFDKRVRRIGYNDYDTALTIKVEREQWSGAAVGLGDNHVFESGLSLGIGTMLGLTKRQDLTIAIETDAGVTLTDRDKNDLIDEVESEEIDFVGHGYISIGYNS